MDKSIRDFIRFSLLLVVSLAAACSLLVFIGEYFTLKLYGYLLLILIIIAVAAALFCLFTSLLVYRIYKKGKAERYLYLPARFALNALLPVILFFSGISKGGRESMRKLYIDINNIFVQSGKMKYHPSEILLLLPHCLQNSECGVKVTGDIGNCKRCGKCCIDDIISLADEYGVKARVVTGGTAARNIIAGSKPRFVLSVACERDLALGIADVGRIPVIGVINERPFGPCLNTRVDIEKLRMQLENVVIKSKE